MPVGFEVGESILWTTLSGIFAASTPTRERVSRLIKAYAPYALGLAVFAFCRIVVYPRLATALGADLRMEFGLESLAMPGISTSSSTPGPFKIVHILFDTLVAPWLNAAAKLLELRPLGSGPGELPGFQRDCVLCGLGLRPLQGPTGIAETSTNARFEQLQKLDSFVHSFDDRYGSYLSPGMGPSLASPLLQ